MRPEAGFFSLDRVLGQEEAISLAKIAAKQRRHLLLLGPPGTGKSMIARAISMQLPAPKSEIRVANNPENPERPFLEVLSEDEVLKENTNLAGASGKLLEPEKVQKNVAEKLGYYCSKCGTYSLPTDLNCLQTSTAPSADSPSRPSAVSRTICWECSTTW